MPKPYVDPSNINPDIQDSAITPPFHHYSGVGPFRAWVQQVLPQVYDDALSYSELIYKLLAHMNAMLNDCQVMEANIAEMGDAFQELQKEVNENLDKMEESFLELQDYVNEFFEEMDVQEEVENVLDRMANDGTLWDIMKPYIYYIAYECVCKWMETYGYVDPSLTIVGAAADASVVGTRLNYLKQMIEDNYGEFQSEIERINQEIAEEIQERISADDNLQSQIDATNEELKNTENTLDQEIADRVNADDNLQSQIDATNEELKSTENTLDQEIQERISADDNLQSQIDATNEELKNTESTLDQEIADRVNAVEDLNNKLTAEESARIAQDNILESEITAINTQIDAVNTKIDSEVNSLVSAITALETKLDSEMKSMQNYVDSALYKYDSQITDLNDKIESVQSSLENKIDQNSQNVEELENRIETLEDNYKDLTDQLVDIQNQLEELESAKSNISGAVLTQIDDQWVINLFQQFTADNNAVISGCTDIFEYNITIDAGTQIDIYDIDDNLVNSTVTSNDFAIPANTAKLFGAIIAPDETGVTKCWFIASDSNNPGVLISAEVKTVSDENIYINTFEEYDNVLLQHADDLYIYFNMPENYDYIWTLGTGNLIISCSDESTSICAETTNYKNTAFENLSIGLQENTPWLVHLYFNADDYIIELITPDVNSYSAIVNISQTVADAEAKIGDLAGSVTDVNSKVDDLTSEVNDLSQSVTNINSKVDDLAETVTTVESNVDSLTSEVNDLSENIHNICTEYEFTLYANNWNNSEQTVTVPNGNDKLIILGMATGISSEQLMACAQAFMFISSETESGNNALVTVNCYGTVPIIDLPLVAFIIGG